MHFRPNGSNGKVKRYKSLKAELQWYRTTFQKGRILARESNNTDDASDNGT